MIVTSNVLPEHPSRLPSLTGLRIVAALMVFGTHIFEVRIFGSPGINAVMSHSLSQGGVGVTFFFILSGFILLWTARDDDTVLRFWRRRAVKIYPNHLVTWLLALILLSLAGFTYLGPFKPWTAGTFLNMFLLQDWFPQAKIYFGMDTPSWSLGCEAFFYLTFPWTLRLVRRIDAKYLWASVAVLIAAVWFAPLIAQGVFHGSNSPLVPGIAAGEDQVWFVYVFPPIRALEFLLGMVLARIVLTGQWIRIGLWLAMLLSFVGYIASSYLPPLYGLVAGAVIPLALIVPAAATADVQSRPSPWRGRTMVWLGNVSFAFYLVHVLVVWTVRYALGLNQSFGTLEGIGITVFTLAVALGAAALIYYAVERPLVRRFSSPRRAKGVVTLAVAGDEAPQGAPGDAGISSEQRV